MSHTDPAAVRLLKRTVPHGVKGVVESGIRMGAAATSRYRPPPDFLVIGTKRGGTTTLWNAIAGHPQVQPMVPEAKHLKGVDYFTWHQDRSPSWYRGHFPTAASRHRHARAYGRSVVGEASPMYLFDPRVPQRVADLLPEVRILVSLRDPVERAFSHWKERVKQGAETLSFTDALAAEPERLAFERERMLADAQYSSRAMDWFAYRTRGEYAGQLQCWFEHVDPARILVIRAESLYSSQSAVLRRVSDFLGLDPMHVAPQWHNRTAQSRMPLRARRELEEHFVPHNRRLAEVLDDPSWAEAWPGSHDSRALQ